jgi:hypothetical protein
LIAAILFTTSSTAQIFKHFPGLGNILVDSLTTCTEGRHDIAVPLVLRFSSNDHALRLHAPTGRPRKFKSGAIASPSREAPFAKTRGRRGLIATFGGDSTQSTCPASGIWAQGHLNSLTEELRLRLHIRRAECQGYSELALSSGSNA